VRFKSKLMFLDRLDGKSGAEKGPNSFNITCLGCSHSFSDQMKFPSLFFPITRTFEPFIPFLSRGFNPPFYSISWAGDGLKLRTLSGPFVNA
jgi:hypothetical protein